MIDCPIFLTVPSGITNPTPNPPVDDNIPCTGCNCGYLQFEDLLEHLKEIRDTLNTDIDEHTELEFKLRKNIAEVSRLFDSEAGVTPGYFSAAHWKTTKVFTTNDTKYIRIPPFVEGSLEVRTLGDVVIDPSSYGVENSHLIFFPCIKHTSCGCEYGCSYKKSRRPRPWPNGCYKVSAKWGYECADQAVQRAVRDFLIESYRLSDPVVVLANGIPVQRTFHVPYTWSSYITNFKAKRKVFSGFAIA